MRILPVLALLMTFCVTAVGQDVIISEVNPADDWIELHNQSGSSVDVSGWYICGKLLYRGLDNSAFNGPPVSIISGTLNIPAGGFLVISWDIDAAGSDVGLYNSTSFGSSTAMEDFMQYNFTGGGGRESVAQTKGIWTIGESVPLPPSGKTLSYFGPGTGASAWDSSEPTQGIDNSALPVELASFDAMLDGRDISLHWSTHSEINNLGFEVQMQSPVDPTFSTVSFVNAGPDGSGVQFYTHTIPTTAPGVHRFRLRQIDIGGAKKYSDIIELAVDVSGSFEISEAYPNPFSAGTTLRFAVARAQSVAVDLVDLNGKVVERVFDGFLGEHENQEVRVTSSGLSSGVYFFRIRGENFMETRSVVLVRNSID